MVRLAGKTDNQVVVRQRAGVIHVFENGRARTEKYWDLPLSDQYRKYTRDCAAYLKWNYDEVKGDSSLLMRLVNGEWNSDDFLVVEPGRSTSPDVNNPGIIKAE